MQQDEHTKVQSTSFGTIAEDYDRYRPGPPDIAVEWLLPAGTVDVIELGAGTGGLTRQLVRRVDRVRAIEPDERMRTVLSARAPEAEVIAGTAEEIPAPDASCDVVCMASAWHWVDEARALPEVARVLRRDGRLSLVWSGPDRTIDWVRELFAGGRQLTPEQIQEWSARRRQRHSVTLGSDSPFNDPEQELFHWTLPMTRDEAIGLVGTFSVAITMDEAQREAYVGAIAGFLDSHEDLLSAGMLEMPMRCLCWRAQLRSD